MEKEVLKMKISTKGRYGINALLYMAMKNRKVSLKEIAEAENISLKYLEQIFSTLKKAEIVESSKGAKGGYSLIKASDKISVFDILKELEGSLDTIEKRETEKLKTENIEYVVVKTVWEKLDEKIESFLSNITLKDIADDYVRFNIDMFYI